LDRESSQSPRGYAALYQSPGLQIHRVQSPGLRLDGRADRPGQNFLRRHFDAALAGHFDGALNQARSLGVLDELADIGKPPRLALRDRQRLQVLAVAVVEDARTRELARIFKQRRTRRGPRIGLAGAKEFERLVGGFRR
jgi:hypothetical protein